jgi:hypothetical protein
MASWSRCCDSVPTVLLPLRIRARVRALETDEVNSVVRGGWTPPEVKLPEAPLSWHRAAVDMGTIQPIVSRLPPFEPTYFESCRTTKHERELP